MLAKSKSSKTFMAEFVKPYCRGMSEKSLKAAVWKTSESLLEIIKRVGQNIGKSKLVIIIIYASIHSGKMF